MSDHHEHHHDEEHDDHSGPLVELVTLRDWLRYACSRFNEAKIFSGHGLQNSYDEAVYLLCHRLHLDSNYLEVFLDACIPIAERIELEHTIAQRVEQRLPAAYITGEAFMGNYRFTVTPEVLIPRSFFGEYLMQGFSPWITEPADIHRVLDLCCGSGCLGIIAADTFPEAHISFADVSSGALEVCRQNIAEYQLEERSEVILSDLFSGFKDVEKFDFILCNPPYVTAESVSKLPPEYCHEPTIALGSGKDGLNFIRRLLDEASNHLNNNGLLAIEVGNNRHIVESAFPDLPLTWLAGEDGDDKIFIIERRGLKK